MPPGALAWCVAIGAAAGIAGCGLDDSWDGVVELSYNERALGGHVKRRMNLLSAGVRLRDDLAADSVWTNVAGHTLIARRSEPGETGIFALRPKRMGIRLRERPVGISRYRLGIYSLDDGFHIVDVFAPDNRYLASAAVSARMPGRRILQHLGLVRRHSPTLDRLYMSPDELVHWRQLLPVIRRNQGYGPLWVQRGRVPPPASTSERAVADSVQISAQAYELEELDRHVLVGRDHPEESYRHIFGAGGDYIMTVIQYGESPLREAGLLTDLALIDTTVTGG